MASRAKNLLGLRFERLLVLSRAENTPRVKSNREGSRWNFGARWNCLCDCGTLVTVRREHLTKGSTLSCGCLFKERMSAAKKTHGHTIGDKPTKAYRSWLSMVGRCTDKKNTSYPRYGGAGITVCSDWLKFENFLRDMGEPENEKLTIDRIDNNKGYFPNNCRWADYKTQIRNRRCTVLSMELAAEIRARRESGLLYKDIGKEFGVCASTVRAVCLFITWT